jgi:hypothetical protein
MVPFAPFVGYGGKEHLEALLRLAARRFIRVRKSLQNVEARYAPTNSPTKTRRS